MSIARGQKVNETFNPSVASLGESVHEPSVGHSKTTSDNLDSVFRITPVPSRSNFAATSRAAGRLNASAITQAEEDRWRAERRDLLKKVVDGTATRTDENRLQYVRWSLDRIDDARMGENLDELERAVDMYEAFLGEVRAIGAQLNVLSKGHR